MGHGHGPFDFILCVGMYFIYQLQFGGAQRIKCDTSTPTCLYYK